MGLLEQILEKLTNIEAALANGAPAGNGAPSEDKPKRGRPAAKKGPTLEEVQNKIRPLAEKGDAVKSKIKAAINKLGGTRAGDFEGDADKLQKLDEALDAIAAEGDGGEEDEDLL